MAQLRDQLMIFSHTGSDLTSFTSGYQQWLSLVSDGHLVLLTHVISEGDHCTLSGESTARTEVPGYIINSECIGIVLGKYNTSDYFFFKVSLK